MRKGLGRYGLAAALLLAVGSAGVAAPSESSAGAEPPLVRLTLTVNTREGAPRVFARPGATAAAWDPSYPVVRGDQVTIRTRGEGKTELQSLRVRVDNKALLDRPASSAEVRVDTLELTTGYHLVEAWAETKGPASRQGSVTTSFLVVPPDDPLLGLLGQRADPGAAGEGDPQLACTLTSPDTQVARAIAATGELTVTGPVQLSLSGGRAVTGFTYTLARNGLVTYRSPRLSLRTLIQLEPRTEDGDGLAPGQVLLTAWGEDATGHQGPSVRLLIQLPAEP